MNVTIYLVEITAIVAGVATVFRYCTGTGYTSAPTDTPANAYYSPRVEQPGLFRQNMYAAGTTSGSSSGGYGDITLMNTDGGLDAFIDYGFDGQQCVVKEGVDGAPLSTFATVITGTIEQPEVSWNRVNFRLKDYTAALNVPVQATKYLGNNALPAGVEGVEDLKDKPKPRLFGKCNNVSAVCVNTEKHIFQINNGAVQAITAVYDNGVGLPFGSDRATNALLQANDPASNTYDTCIAEGLLRLGSAQSGQITCDAVQGATAAARTAGQIIKTLATEQVGANRIVVQSIIDLDKAAPYVCGYYTGDAETTVTEILDALCASVGAWFGFDNNGNFWAKQLTAPVAGQALVTLTKDEIGTDIQRLSTADSDKGVPIWRVNVDHSRNWTVQTGGLAGSIDNNQLTFEPGNTTQLTTPRRALLGMEYLRVSSSDASVKTTHLLAPELTVATTLDSTADATTEATRLLTMRKVRRDRLRVTVPKQAIQYPAGGYWDDEAISEMPVSVYAHRSVVYGNWLYVLGGWDSSFSILPKVVRLDLTNSTGAWDDAGVTDLPDGLVQQSASMHSNWLYVAGGYNPTNLTDKVIRLDLSNPAGAWDDAGVTDLPSARGGHGAAVYGNWLYIIGGDTSTGQTNKVIRLDLSNPAGAWDDAGVTDLPSARYGSTCVTYGNWLYVIGGEIDGLMTNKVIRLDLSNPTGAWDDAGVTDLPDASEAHAAAIKGNLLYLMGGAYFGMGKLGRVYVFDLTNPAGAWDDAGATDLPQGRSFSSAVNYNGSIYLTGGNVTLAYSNTWRLRTNDNPDDSAHRVSIGRTVFVQHPRYGYATGRPMRIIGTESDYKNRRVTLELWG